MKKLFLLTALAVAVFGKAAIAADFPVTAIIPRATSVQYVVSRVTPGNPPVFQAHGSFDLNFADGVNTAMQYDAVNGIWTSNRFFAIDLATVDGNGTPSPGVYQNVTFSYNNNVVPEGQPATEGLNKRAGLTAVRVDGSGENLIVAGALGNNFTPITDAQITGGWLRVYVGLATGEEVNGVPVLPGTVPFTNADKPGTYTGTLTITATLT